MMNTFTRATNLRLFVLVMLFGASVGMSAQAPANDGRIDGTVVDGSTRMPASQVRVVLSSLAPNSPPRFVTTDKDGAFSFDRLGASAFPYFINVQQDGFRLQGASLNTANKGGVGPTAATVDQNTSGSPPIVVTPGARVHIEMRIIRVAVVSGRVFDADRTPVVDGSVELIPAQDSGTAAGSRRRIATDSQGQFSFDDVLPGEYFVQASTARTIPRTDLRGGRSNISLPDPFSAVYYPGTRYRELAARVNATPGSVFNAVEFVLPPSAPGRISGKIDNTLAFALETDPTLIDYQRKSVRGVSTSQSTTFGKDDAAAYSFYLVPKDKPPSESLPVGPLPDYDDDAHTFEWRNIPVGRYDLFVVFQPNTRDGFKWHTYAGKSLVTVASETVDVAQIHIEQNADAFGKITLDDSPAARGMVFSHAYPSLTAVDPIPDVLRIDPRLAQANFVEKDGSFRIPGGVPPGRYWVGIQEWRLPPGVYVNSATVNGGSSLAASVTIVGDGTYQLEFEVRGDGGTLTGVVSDRDRRVLTNARVVLLSVADRPADPNAHRFASTNALGEFTIDGVRPDRYTVFAFYPGINDAVLRDRTAVSVYSGQAKKVDVRSNEKIQLNLDAITR